MDTNANLNSKTEDGITPSDHDEILLQIDR
jgi:hypothetical protein